MSAAQTHYQTLGVEPTASAAEIKQAYRLAAKAAHPDRAGGSAERMAAVNKAYDVLGDAAKRKRYDETGDVAEKAVDVMAGELLTSMFTAAFDQDKGDWLAVARTWLAEYEAKLRGAQMEAHAKLGKAKRHAGRLKTREGVPNIAAGIVDRAQRGAQRQLAEIAESLEAARTAQKMLAEYEPVGMVRKTADQAMDALQNAFAGLRS